MLNLWLAVFLAAADSPSERVPIPGGEFTPLYRPEKDSATVQVAPFLLDRTPVTQGDFLRFVLANPRWNRSAAPGVFRDEHYLTGWISDPALQAATAGSPPPDRQPVVYVSWFAARAYCAAQGKRLPTAMEWEYAAAIGWVPDSAGRKEALRWYTTPHDGLLPEVGSGPPNALGLHDLHRLWEWVEDFNAGMLRGDNRSDADEDRNLYCGGASADAVDKADYAAFMRYAFRSSLKASYGTHNLGFRCARDP